MLGDRAVSDQGLDRGTDLDRGVDPDGRFVPDAATGLDRGLDGSTTDRSVNDFAVDADIQPDAMLLDACGRPLAGPNAARTVLIGHRNGRAADEIGTIVRSLVLHSDGTLVDVGDRLDVGDRPAQIAIAPHGRLALVVGEEGTVTVVDISDPANLRVVDVTTVPPGEMSDLVFDPDGQMAFLVRNEVDEETGGVYTLRLACDGGVTVSTPHFGLRLAQKMALLPQNPNRAIVLGGQAMFDPQDPDDVRVLSRRDDVWVEDSAYDIYAEFVVASGIAVAANGTVLVSSGEAAQVAILDLVGDAIREVRRLQNVIEADQVLIAPDGQTAIVLRPNEQQITVLDGARGWQQAGDAVVGRASEMAMVRRGRGAGIVLIPGVHAGTGPRMTVLKVDAGRAIELNRVDLGPGNDNVPGPIGVRP